MLSRLPREAAASLRGREAKRLEPVLVPELEPELRPWLAAAVKRLEPALVRELARALAMEFRPWLAAELDPPLSRAANSAPPGSWRQRRPVLRRPGLRRFPLRQERKRRDLPKDCASAVGPGLIVCREVGVGRIKDRPDHHEREQHAFHTRTLRRRSSLGKTTEGPDPFLPPPVKGRMRNRHRWISADVF